MEIVFMGLRAREERVHIFSIYDYCYDYYAEEEEGAS